MYPFVLPQANFSASARAGDELALIAAVALQLRARQNTCNPFTTYKGMLAIPLKLTRECLQSLLNELLTEAMNSSSSRVYRGRRRRRRR